MEYMYLEQDCLCVECIEETTKSSNDEDTLEEKLTDSQKEALRRAQLDGGKIVMNFYRS